MQPLEHLDVPGPDIASILDQRRRSKVTDDPIVQREAAVLVLERDVQRTCVVFAQREHFDLCLCACERAPLKDTH